jgi:hypothetical protein
MSASRRVQDLDPVDAAYAGQLDHGGVESDQSDPESFWPEPTFDELVSGLGRHRHGGGAELRRSGRTRWFRGPSSRPRRARTAVRGAAR